MALTGIRRPSFINYRFFNKFRGLNRFTLSFRVTLLSLRCRIKRATAGAAVKSCSRSKRITTFGHRKSGKRERIRNTQKGERRIAAPLMRRSRLPARSVLLLRRGVHGHPHRNDGQILFIPQALKRTE